MTDFLFSPLTWVVASTLVVIFWYRNRAARWLATSVAVASIALMTPLVANALLAVAESKDASDADCAADAPRYVVVLAGGADREPQNTSDVSALSSDTVYRLLAGFEVFSRASQDAHLMLVGGGPYSIRESDVMRTLALRLGIPETSISVETDSTTTWESAQRLAKLTPVPHRFWLVTSALHMPRAMLALRHAGFEPCSFSSGSFYVPPGGLGYFIPHTSSLIKSEAAIHEILGNLAYRIRAWKDDDRHSTDP